MITPQFYTRAHMRDYVDVNPGLVTRKHVPTHPHLYVLKYKNKVFYDNKWTPELCEFRGTVVDEHYKVIMRPFTKVFNYGENNTTIHRDEPVTISRKINGFMAQATWHNGEFLVGTTGTLTSDYAKLAREWLYGLGIDVMLKKFEDGYTYIFEIVDPDDPHIVEENYGVYLLGIRNNQWNTPQSFFCESYLDDVATYFGAGRPEWQTDLNFQQAKDHVKFVKHEGFMVTGLKSGTILKLKSPFYLATKFLGRIRPEKLEKLLENKREFRKTIDEEFYPIIDCLDANLEEFSKLGREDRVVYVRNFFDKHLTGFVS